MSFLFLALLLTPTASNDPWPPEVWTRQTEPFHIVGPVYYVGGRELTAYLIVDEAGLVLVNIGMVENVPLVFDAIRKLGFNPKNIRHLAITQAHMDHAGGAARVVELTGARVWAGLGDVPLMRAGGLRDYVFGDDLPFAAVPKTQGLKHGEKIHCGELILTTIATPGHTPGSSSWLLTLKGEDKPIDVLFQGSISVLGDADLIDNPFYPGVVADFKNSFKRLESLKPDYVLPDHMVFAHPPGVTHDHPPQATWFTNSEITSSQIQRSRRLLKKKLEGHH